MKARVLSIGALLAIAAVASAQLLPVQVTFVTTNVTGATITIDGRVRGTTPVTISLRPGRYRLAISAAGYTTHSEMLEIGNAGRQELRFALERARAAAVQATRPVERTVAVNISANAPGARFTIDNTVRGTAPGNVDLTVGQHRVQMTAADYRTTSSVIDVTAQAGQAFNIAMKPTFATVDLDLSAGLTSGPQAPLSGVSVTVDGRPIDVSGGVLGIHVEGGSHAIAIISGGLVFVASQIFEAGVNYAIRLLPLLVEVTGSSDDQAVQSPGRSGDTPSRSGETPARRR